MHGMQEQWLYLSPYTLLPIRLGDRWKANRRQDRRKGKSCSKQEVRHRINLKPTLIFESNEERVDFSTKVPGYGWALTQTFTLSANLNAYCKGEGNPTPTAGLSEHVSFSHILSHFHLLLCSLLFPAPSYLLALCFNSDRLSWVCQDWVNFYNSQEGARTGLQIILEVILNHPMSLPGAGEKGALGQRNLWSGVFHMNHLPLLYPLSLVLLLLLFIFLSHCCFQ